MVDGQEESGSKPTTSTGLDPKLAGLLSYLFGWISGLIIFLIEKDDKTVRFHALQSIFFNVALIIVGIAMSIIIGIIAVIPGLNLALIAIVPIFYAVFWIGTLVVWILLMVRAYQGEKWKLPVIGDIAEQNA